MPFDVIHEALQTAHSPRAAEQAAMHSDAHHRRPHVCLGVLHVEGVAQVIKEPVPVSPFSEPGASSVLDVGAE